MFWSDVTEEAIFSAHIDEGQVFAYIALYSITIIFVHNLSRILEIDPSPSCSPTLLQTFYLLKQQTALANYEQFEYEFVLIFSTELWWRLMESSQQMGLQSTGYLISLSFFIVTVIMIMAIWQSEIAGQLTPFLMYSGLDALLPFQLDINGAADDRDDDDNNDDEVRIIPSPKVHSHLYWTDTGTNAISVCDFTGMSRYVTLR